MTLGDFLADGARRPWVDGEHDCTMWPANWVRTWGLGDPASQWRGYSTAEEAHALIKCAGSLAALWSVGLKSIGIYETDDPQIGDVGIIYVLGSGGPEKVGAIKCEKRWAFLSSRGVAYTHAEHISAWARP